MADKEYQDPAMKRALSTTGTALKIAAMGESVHCMKQGIRFISTDNAWHWYDANSRTLYTRAIIGPSSQIGKLRIKENVEVSDWLYVASHTSADLEGATE